MRTKSAMTISVSLPSKFLRKKLTSIQYASEQWKRTLRITAKTPYDEKLVPRKFLTAETPYGGKSIRQKLLTAKAPYVGKYNGKNSHGKVFLQRKFQSCLYPRSLCSPYYKFSERYSKQYFSMM